MHKILAYLMYLLPTVVTNVLLFILYCWITHFPLRQALVHGLLLTTLFVLSDFILRHAFASLGGTGKGILKARCYAMLCVMRGLAVTPVYVLSAVSMLCWQECFHYDAILALPRNVPALVSAFGPGVYVVIALLLACLILYIVWKLWRAERDYQIFMAINLPASRRILANPDLLMVVVLIPVLDLAYFNCVVSLDDQFIKDPVIVLYTNSNDTWYSASDVMADKLAGEMYPRGLPHRSADVIIIGVECLRSDHLSAYGYNRDTTPFLRSLIKDNGMGKVGVAVSVGNKTNFGVLGTLASRFGVNLRKGSLKVHEVLKKQGYGTYLIGSGDLTRFFRMQEWYGPDFDLIHDGYRPEGYWTANDEEVLDTLGSLPQRGDHPAFFYIHLSSPHALGVKKPAFKKWVSGPQASAEEKYVNAYDNGILQADDTIQKVLGILKAKGYMNDYLFFIEGDHGESLGENGAFGHGDRLRVEEVRIPLLWKDSALVKTPDYPFASQVDIAPTILQSLGLPIPAVWDGLPFDQVYKREDTIITSIKVCGWVGLVRPSHQGLVYLRRVDDSTGETELAFHLTDGAREMTDQLPTLSISERLSLRAKLRAYCW